MDIYDNRDGIQLVWEYAIKNNKAKKTNKDGKTVEYIFHTTTLPGDIVRYFGHPHHIYLYTWEGEHILTDTEPTHAEYVKVVLMDKGQQDARNITVSKKVFHLNGYTDKKVRYTFHTTRETFDGKHMITMEII